MATSWLSTDCSKRRTPSRNWPICRSRPTSRCRVRSALRRPPADAAVNVRCGGIAKADRLRASNSSAPGASICCVTATRTQVFSTGDTDIDTLGLMKRRSIEVVVVRVPRSVGDDGAPVQAPRVERVDGAGHAATLGHAEQRCRCVVGESLERERSPEIERVSRLGRAHVIAGDDPRGHVAAADGAANRPLSRIADRRTDRGVRDTGRALRPGGAFALATLVEGGRGEELDLPGERRVAAEIRRRAARRSLDRGRAETLLDPLDVVLDGVEGELCLGVSQHRPLHVAQSPQARGVVVIGGVAFGLRRARSRGDRGRCAAEAGGDHRCRLGCDSSRLGSRGGEAGQAHRVTGTGRGRHVDELAHRGAVAGSLRANQVRADRNGGEHEPSRSDR